MPAALAPDISIQAVPQGKPRTDVQLTLVTVGGTYDTIEYQWTDDSPRTRAEGFNDSTLQNPIWTRAVPQSEDVWFELTCVVTVRGTGVNADDGTTDTIEDIEIVRVYYVPIADAPSLIIYPIPDGLERSDTFLRAEAETTHIGNYDSISLQWFCHRGNNFATDISDSVFPDGPGSGRTDGNPRFVRPSTTGDSNETVRVSCVATVIGTNNDALIGTSDTVTATEDTVILDYPSVTVPGLTFVQHNDGDPDRESQWSNTGGNGTEGTTTWLRVTQYPGKNYDELTYAWSWKWHDEGDSTYKTIPGNTKNVQWTRPHTAHRRQYDLRCISTASGNDTVYEAGSTQSSTRFGDEYATYINPLPAVSAPGVVIGHFVPGETVDGVPAEGNGVPNGVEETTVHLFSTVEFGSYDEIQSIEWTVVDSNGQAQNQQLSDVSIENPIWTRPTVNADERYTINCFYTVVGTDTNYNAPHARQDGPQGRAVGSHSVTTTVRNRPNADVPSIDLNTIPNGGPRSQIVLDQMVIGRSNSGTYDRLTYFWEVNRFSDFRSSGNISDTLSDQYVRAPTWSRPDNATGSDVTYHIRATLTGSGQDINASAGTSESTHAQASTSVVHIPVAEVPANNMIHIDAVPDGYVGDKVQLHATVPDTATSPGSNHGYYDRLTYLWQYEFQNYSITQITGDTQSVNWTRVNSPSGTNTQHRVKFRLRVTAHGDGNLARTGSVAHSGVIEIYSNVDPRPPVPPVILRMSNESGTPIDILHIGMTDEDGIVTEINRRVISTNASRTPTEIYNSGT